MEQGATLHPAKVADKIVQQLVSNPSETQDVSEGISTTRFISGDVMQYVPHRHEPASLPWLYASIKLKLCAACLCVSPKVH